MRTTASGHMAPTSVNNGPMRAARQGLVESAFRRLLRSKPAMVGLICIILLVGLALLAPILAPDGPYAGSLANRFQPPTVDHLMGTDGQGRDEFARVLYGARTSLQVGVIAVTMALLIGVVVGALAGGLGGRVDSVCMRIVDVLLAVPGILLAIGVVAWLGRGLPQLMLAIAITYAGPFARLLRGSLLSQRESEYILAAQSIGASKTRVLLRHALPNALTPVIVQATLVLATAIIDIAGLGFLGLGPPDPRTAEWGTMLTDARDWLNTAPWLVLFPGIAVSISAIGFNLFGDGLRESLDPRQRR
jgi:peptide/nickel transport system permease protein